MQKKNPKRKFPTAAVITTVISLAVCAAIYICIYRIGSSITASDIPAANTFSPSQVITFRREKFIERANAENILLSEISGGDNTFSVYNASMNKQIGQLELSIREGYVVSFTLTVPLRLTESAVTDAVPDTGSGSMIETILSEWEKHGSAEKSVSETELRMTFEALGKAFDKEMTVFPADYSAFIRKAINAMEDNKVYETSYGNFRFTFVPPYSDTSSLITLSMSCSD